MKKMVALFIALVMLLPVVCLADPAEVSSMTDEELKEMISACSAELRKRAAVEPDLVLLFDLGGVRIYQTGEAYISESGRLKVPVIVYNDLDEKISVSIIDPTINDFVVHGYIYPQLPPHSKAKDELDFSSEDVELTGINDIYSLILGCQIYSVENRKYLSEPTERT